MNRSALRSAALLIAVGRHPGGATAAELAEETGVPRPTAFRLLLSLAHTGLLARDGGSFSLGLRIAQLGRLADPYRALLPRIQANLDRLAAEFNESAEYTAFTGPTTQETIAQGTGARLLATSQRYVGRSFPLHASGTGKILLATLGDDEVAALLPKRLETFTPRTIATRSALLTEIADVRRQGYATLDGELEEGLFVVAVPVRDSAGEVVGAVAVSGLDQRMRPIPLAKYVAALGEAAREIGAIVSGRAEE